MCVEVAASAMAGRVKRRWAREPRGRDSDQERLIDSLRSRDPSAVATLQSRYGSVLTGFLRSALPDPASAEDVRQQVLLEVWRRGPDYDPARGSLLTWMMMIARSRAIDERRRRRPEPIDPTVLNSTGDAADGQLDELIERWRLADLLGRIPREEALVLRLRFYEGLPQSEIAKRTELPLGTVKTRMVAGLARLRQLISEEEQRR
jgi:RNA polymerase sigma-70 factor (ECF subfamily)